MDIVIARRLASKLRRRLSAVAGDAEPLSGVAIAAIYGRGTPGSTD